MIQFVLGALLLSAATAAFWHLLPRDGVPHRLAVTPYLQVWIPIGLTCGLVVGAGLLVSGLVNLSPL